MTAQNPLYTGNQISLPIDKVFTEDFAYFLVNTSTRPLQTSAEDEKLAITAHEKGIKLEAPISYLDSSEGEKVNKEKIDYVRGTWDQLSNEAKSSLMAEYAFNLVQGREGEELVGFSKDKNGKTQFPSGFAGFLKGKITGGKDNKRQDLDAYWSGLKETRKDALITEYCNSGRDAEAKEKALTEIITSYSSRSKEGIARVDDLIAKAMTGEGEIKKTKSSYASISEGIASGIASAALLFGSFSAAAATDAPSQTPSQQPTLIPTFIPTTSAITATPSNIPSSSPTFSPSKTPTLTPSGFPSLNLTSNPTSTPTFLPTSTPTFTPTITPSLQPTLSPTTPKPTRLEYSNYPTGTPTTERQNPNFGQPTLKPTQKDYDELSTGELAAIGIAAVVGACCAGGVIMMCKGFFCNSDSQSRPNTQNSSRGRHQQLANTGRRDAEYTV